MELLVTLTARLTMDNVDAIYEILSEEALEKLGAEPPEEADESDDYETTDKDFVEVEEEDARGVTELYGRLRQIQMELGSLLVQFETRKSELLDDFEDTQNAIEEELRELERQYKIPHGDQFTFNVPPSPGEKGLFYRRGVDEEERKEALEDAGIEEETQIDKTTVDTSQS